MDRHRTKVKSTKNKQARRFSVEAEILPLLLARCDEAKAAGSMTLIPKMPGVERLSTMFREHLKLVGVGRAELFINDKTRKHITFHDLRATGIRWMAVRGDEPLRIKHRAGHISFSTTEGYIREAEQVRDGFGDVFPKLPVSLVPPAPVPTPDPLATIPCVACESSSASCDAEPVASTTSACSASSQHDDASWTAEYPLGCSLAQLPVSIFELLPPDFLAELLALVSSDDSSVESSEDGADLRNLRSRFRDLNSRPTVYEKLDDDVPEVPGCRESLRRRRWKRNPAKVWTTPTVRGITALTRPATATNGWARRSKACAMASPSCAAWTRPTTRFWRPATRKKRRARDEPLPSQQRHLGAA